MGLNTLHLREVHPIIRALKHVFPIRQVSDFHAIALQSKWNTYEQRQLHPYSESFSVTSGSKRVGSLRVDVRPTSPLKQAPFGTLPCHCLYPHYPYCSLGFPIPQLLLPHCCPSIVMRLLPCCRLSRLEPSDLHSCDSLASTQQRTRRHLSG